MPSGFCIQTQWSPSAPVNCTFYPQLHLRALHPRPYFLETPSTCLLLLQAGPSFTSTPALSCLCLACSWCDNLLPPDIYHCWNLTWCTSSINVWASLYSVKTDKGLCTAASRVDAHIERMDVEYTSVREIHRLHIPLGLEGCQAFTTFFIFPSRNRIKQKGSPKCLSPHWLSKEILLLAQTAAA